MDLLKLEESELLEMRRFYEEELEKTLKRLQHLKGVLEKLGASGPSINIIISDASEKEANVASPVSEVEEASESNEANSDEESSTSTRKPRRKKTGPKPFWEDAIMNLLRETGKPLTYEELTDQVLAAQNLPEEKRTSTKQAITNVVFRLRQRGVKVNTFSAGKKEKYVALKRWFDSEGNIKDDFRNMVVEVKPKKKRGRKKKSETQEA